MIKMQNVRKTYPGFDFELSLEIPEGRITGLIGKNGAGKSTAIRLMLGLVKAESGTIELFGKPITEITMQDRQKIGVSLAESGFNGQFTIAEVKKILAKMYPKFDETWFMRECRELRLPEGKQLKEFSNGMKAKLRVLTALSHKAQLLILDEPTTGLDLGGREIALRALSRVGAEQSDRAVILVTHRLEEIPQGFDHVAIMGRITGNETDAYADNVAGNDPAPGTIVYTGDLEHGFTSERLSQVFGLDLKVTHANGRWNAYAV